MKHLEKIHNKLIPAQSIKDLVQDLKQKGKSIVFTNGCFDILHKGHVTYLAQAADFGDVLIVGINSDDSVRRQGKGPDRPVNLIDARGMILAALDMVTFVVSFEEDTPLSLINSIVPDVLIKGGDYDPKVENPADKKYIVGREVVLKNGGKVDVINLVDGFSTTGIIQKLKK
jgi:rfaE bifunctional protein nucleotidyltransferase chain/domain